LLLEQESCKMELASPIRSSSLAEARRGRKIGGSCLFAGFSFSYAEGLLSPVVQCVSILKNVYRDLVVLHDGLLVRKGLERAHARRFVVGTVGVVNFEIEDVVCNHSEKQALKVEPRAAEHPSRLDRPQAFELIDHICEIFVTDRHSVYPLG